MGPKRNRPSRSRATPYDPALMENWTLLRLQQECTRKGIAFRSNMRRFALVRLLRENEQGEAIAHAPNDNETNVGGASSGSVNNNGSAHGQIPVLVDLVSSLQDTVSALQNSVISLEQKVNNIATSNPTPASSTAQQNQTEGSSCPPPIPPRVRSTNNILPQICLPQSRNGLNVPPIIPAVSESRNYVNLPAEPPIQPASNSEFDINSAYQAAQLNGNFAAGSQSQLSGMASANSSNRGVSAQSLPLVETTSPALRNAIILGRDVNLASLLIPYYNGQTDKDSKDERPDPRLNRSLTIGEFIQAFGAYKHIMCKAFPQRRNELDNYERDIVEMATRYNGKGFYDYHRQFSLRAASHLRYNNILVDWSIRDNTLFCNIFANFQPVICIHCNSTMHSSDFCETIVNQRYNFNRRGLGMAQNNFNQGRMFGDNTLNNETDTRGRLRVMHLGKEICNHFNGPNGCFARNCPRLHACVKCKGPHSANACPLGSTWPQSRKK